MLADRAIKAAIRLLFPVIREIIRNRIGLAIIFNLYLISSIQSKSGFFSILV